MRIKTMISGGYNTRGFVSPGGTMLGPLILSRNPVDDLEAATKLYTDTKLTNFAAESFTTGTLLVDRMPAFAGDLVSSPGTNNLVMPASGVDAGIYTSAYISNKGLVTSAGGLDEDLIPDLGWDKIAFNTPTTLVGYGITDGVNIAGGEMDGQLVLFSDPTNDMHVATKQYVDLNAVAVNCLSTGDIISKNTSVTPAGFFRCNGGAISKTTYAPLFTVVGETFSILDMPGSGRPWQQQYYINSSQTADIGSWTTGATLPAIVTSAAVIVTKTTAYILGGENDTVALDMVYKATINPDGTLGAWSAGTALPGALSRSQAVVTYNYVYLIGGHDGTSYVATVYRASLNTDGTLGAWETVTSLPSALGSSASILTKKKVYLFGGFDSLNNLVTTSFVCDVNTDGSLGTWTATTPLPINMANIQVAFTKGRIYLIGGYNGSPAANVYMTTVDLNGAIGSWIAASGLPDGLHDAAVFVTKYRIYLIGGKIAAGTTSNVYTAPLNGDGTIGTWTTGTSLPGVGSGLKAFATVAKIYLVGLKDATLPTNIVYTASITGGLNDYGPYYNGTIETTDPANFRLPDLNIDEIEGTYSYIKI